MAKQQKKSTSARKKTDSTPDYGDLKEARTMPTPDRFRLKVLKEGVEFVCKYPNRVEEAIRIYFLPPVFYQNGLPADAGLIDPTLDLFVYSQNQYALIDIGVGVVGYAMVRRINESYYFLFTALFRSVTQGWVYAKISAGTLSPHTTYVVRLASANPIEPVVDKQFSTI